MVRPQLFTPPWCYNTACCCCHPCMPLSCRMPSADLDRHQVCVTLEKEEVLSPRLREGKIQGRTGVWLRAKLGYTPQTCAHQLIQAPWLWVFADHNFLIQLPDNLYLSHFALFLRAQPWRSALKLLYLSLCMCYNSHMILRFYFCLPHSRFPQCDR